MHPRIAANQQRTFLAQLGSVLPHVRTDSALPRRIKELLGRNRAFGSRDRRLYRELIYTVIRYLPWIEPLLARDENSAAQLTAWLAPEMKDTSAYRTALLEGWPPTPSTLQAKSEFLQSRFSGQSFKPTDLLPAWFHDHCPDAFDSLQLDALLARAPIWVRLQVNDRAMVLDEFRRKSWEPRATELLPDAFALPPNAEVANTDAYRRGFVEIQDLGSQLVLAHAPVRVGEKWLDACAGAGGKTLQLARAVGDTGQVDARDIRPAMLEELRERANRARLSNVRISSVSANSYDGVLVDAPCSGSGTWRRLPHMKWQTQSDTLAEFATQQLSILAGNASFVRAGGLLVYATCSLSHVENHDVAASFLASAPAFEVEPPFRDCGGRFDGLGTTIMPAEHNSDGFYVALFRRKS